MEWKEQVNDYIITFRVEDSAEGFVFTATRHDGRAAMMEFEQLPHKDDVSTLFISNPEYREMVGYD
jgi:hypothetical protein